MFSGLELEKAKSGSLPAGETVTLIGHIRKRRNARNEWAADWATEKQLERSTPGWEKRRYRKNQKRPCSAGEALQKAEPAQGALRCV
jgi:hypothetical protein